MQALQSSPVSIVPVGIIMSAGTAIQNAPHRRLFPECDTYPSNACCNPTERKQAMTLADRGFLCVIVCMPFNLAVLDANGADGVRERFPAVRRWILMGHSLGPIPPPTSPTTASRC